MNIEEYKKERDEWEAKHPVLSYLNEIRWSLWRDYHKVVDFPTEVKWAFQRMFRGYGDDDLWCLDSYIVRRIRPALKAFVKEQKEHGLGCPDVFFDNDKQAEGKECHKWIAELEKMELAFDLLWEDDMATKDWFAKTSEQHIENHKKIEEGLASFAKNFHGLWD